MQSLRYVLLLLIWPVFAHSQFKTGLSKDSLKELISAAPEDTATALNYIWLGQQYEANTPDSAAYFYEKAHALSERLHYARGIVYYVNNYTGILNTQGRYDESLRLHEQAVALCRKYHFDQLLLKSLFNIGVVYQYKQDYKTAADHYMKILPLLEKGDVQTRVLVYNNLTAMYQQLEEPEKGLPYARKAVALATEAHDLYLLGQTSNNLANILRDMNVDKEAARYLRLSIQVAEQTNDMNLKETALINLADMMSSTEAPEKYMALYREAVPLADSIQDISGIALLKHGIARGYYWEKNFDSAQQVGLEGLAYARANDQPEVVSKMLLLLSDVAIARGDLEAGNRYHKAYDSAYSAARDPELKKHLQELETRYEVSQQQEHILRQDLLLAQQNRETLRQRVLLAATVFVLLLLGCFVFWYYRYSRKAMTALKAEQENTRLRSLLEGQLQERKRISQEMHDEVGAGLTSLLFLSRGLSDPVAGRLQQTAQHLVQQMNEIIWTMNHTQDTLDSLVAYVRQHIAEALDNAGINYHFEVDSLPEKEIGQELRRNVYLVCKEAVHNIVRHSEATRVNIRISVDEQLHVRIADNGRGLPADGGSRFGNGLRNMTERMARVQGRFTIRPGDNGTIVEIAVPV